MLRRCDGTDPNLTQHVTPDGERIKVAPYPAPIGTKKSCDCGKVFDDAGRMTIWPHEQV